MSTLPWLQMALSLLPPLLPLTKARIGRGALVFLLSPLSAIGAYTVDERIGFLVWIVAFTFGWIFTVTPNRAQNKF